MKRCKWVNLEDKLYVDYHDNEWGKPACEDQQLFEFLTLESFQAGLSWITILRKREAFRRSFDDFDIGKVAEYDGEKVAALLGDSSIVRNRQKIEAAINNARATQKVQAEFGSFGSYAWGFTDSVQVDNRFKNSSDVPVLTDQSKLMAADLKRRGFKFFGPTTAYAFMQATGMVNDHLLSCDFR